MKHEGRTYVCAWETDDSGYRIWIKRWPKVRGEGKTVQQAIESLHAAIETTFGDFEAEIDFDGPAPWDLERSEFRQPSLVILYGEVSAFHGPEDRAFEAGLCPMCHHGIGGRTSIPLWMENVDPPFDAGGLGVNSQRPFVSDRFLALLEPEERAACEFRPIQSPPDSKRRYFELLGERLAAFVVVQKFPPVGQWLCPICGNRMMRYDPSKSPSPFESFICREDLPHPLPSFFLVGNGGFVSMCMTTERWWSLKGKVGTKGIHGIALGVVGREQVNSSPALTLYSDPGPDGEYEFFDYPLPPSPKWYKDKSA